MTESNPDTKKQPNQDNIAKLVLEFGAIIPKADIEHEYALRLQQLQDTAGSFGMFVDGMAYVVMQEWCKTEHKRRDIRYADEITTIRQHW
ncbi:MAG TPA: hypothetical protein VJK72_00290 [Candidatus Nanoarchaeia archaeon]|nr:hypothetical protein [Candidatus Nanoarchaeia archaeon]